jgi:hypothetical protein
MPRFLHNYFCRKRGLLRNPWGLRSLIPRGKPRGSSFYKAGVCKTRGFPGPHRFIVRANPTVTSEKGAFMERPFLSGGGITQDLQDGYDFVFSNPDNPVNPVNFSLKVCSRPYEQNTFANSAG